MKNKSKKPSVLALNRGEIAQRIIKAGKELHLHTIALCSEADQKLSYLNEADEVICLPGRESKETYLNQELLLKIIQNSNVHLVHPGYGFLSENYDFAKKVEALGSRWIGPSPEAIQKLGSKIEAKKLAESLHVSTLPWALLSSEASFDSIQQAALKIGFPLIVKASDGGGGRGMRLVHSMDQLQQSIESARRESQSAFSSESVFLEAYRPIARHLEVQILGDHSGHISVWGTRDCSLQRRYQKVLEEAPAPDLNKTTEELLYQWARQLAQGVNYKNAGTCEFLLDTSGQAYFLEMNTRLQVEHPVTELIFGVDLVKTQIRVAQGELLKDLFPHPQSPRGHAIEVRLYAEDPRNQFAPSPGIIESLETPVGPGYRVDTGYKTGDTIPIEYDAMIAKLMTWGETREEALARLTELLMKTKCRGFIQNQHFLLQIINHPDFVKFKDFNIYTKWIEKNLLPWKPSAITPPGRESPKTWASLLDQLWSNDQKTTQGSNPSYFLQNSASDHNLEGEENSLDGPLVCRQYMKIVKINCSEGSRVEKNQCLLVAEAMKMELQFLAPTALKIERIHIKTGETIVPGTNMITWVKL